MTGAAGPRPPWRIALIASSRYPVREPFAGGLEAHVWTMARALQRRGHEVTVFAAPGSDPRLGTGVLSIDEVDVPSGHRRDITHSPSLERAEDHAYRSLMTRLGTDLADAFDVVHNHSLHPLPIARCGSLRRPLISTLHTPPFPRLAHAHARIVGADPRNGGVRCVAVSEHAARAWRPIVADLRVVRHGIDVDLWPAGPGRGSLVWFGRLVPEKGPHLAIAAARACGRRLALAGPAVDTRYFDDEIAPHLGDDVVYHGHLDQRELATLVGASSAALVTPQWDEPFGLVVPEALACGTPVVAFARGGIPETLTPSCGRLVAPGDVAAMAAAVPAVEQLSRAGARRRAESHCSVEVMVDRLESLYAETAGSARSAASVLPVPS